MTLPTRPLTALVCDDDLIARAAYASAAQEAGFDVLEQADNAARALHLFPFHRASLVITSQELFGMSGLEALREFRQLDDPPEVVIIAADTSIRDQALGDGAFAVIERGDPDALLRVLSDVRHLFETGERRSRGDRRSGVDRRQRQDWTKVTIERRSGVDRRQRDRRSNGESANASVADPATAPQPEQH
ncbi:MAG: response regulator [Acidimicrobiales bacterium]|nr:response regulator [Acidimicrobiales bacterium]